MGKGCQIDSDSAPLVRLSDLENGKKETGENGNSTSVDSTGVARRENLASVVTSHINDGNINGNELLPIITNYELIFERLPNRTIRVLDLLPGSGRDQICVKLRSTSVDSPEAYEALSYTWGCPARPVEIQVNGYSFAATQNLIAALTRFRDPSSPRTLWIDAICINQSSVNERNQQVRMMAEIYSKAANVLAYMGEAKNEAALKTLFNIAHERNTYAEVKQWLKQPHGKTPLFLHSTDAQSLKIVAAVQEEYNRRLEYTPIDKTHHPLEIKTLQEQPDFLFIGYKSLPGRHDADNASSILMIMPDFRPDHVQQSALRSYPSFEEFLIEAAKPDLLELSDLKMMDVLHGLDDLVNREYWQRAWIVQEIITAQNCTVCFAKRDLEIDIETLGSVYGTMKRTGIDIKNFMIEDYYLSDAVKNLQVINRLLPLQSSRNALNSIFAKDRLNLFTFSHLTHDRISHAGRSWKFEEPLLKYFKQRATDPRDKIFSLISLLQHFSTSPEEHEWYRQSVDYSLDTKSVYLSAAKYLVESYEQRRADDTIIKSSHILDDFYRTRDEGINLTQLPSWVPNWASENDKSVSFQKARNREIDILIPYDAQVSDSSLILSSHIVDEVSWVSESINTTRGMYDELSIWLKVLEHNFGAVYDNENARFDAFWRTVIVDNPGSTKFMDDLTYHFQDDEPIRLWLRHCRERIDSLRLLWGDKLQDRSTLGRARERMQDITQGMHKPGQAVQALKLAASSSKSHISFENVDIAEWQVIADALAFPTQEEDPPWQSQAVRMELSKRHFVVTKKGYFGLGSPGVQKDDFLVLLAGSSSPWYLRPKEVGVFQISARAWVHGLMYKSDYYYKDWVNKTMTQVELR